MHLGESRFIAVGQHHLAICSLLSEHFYFNLGSGVRQLNAPCHPNPQ
jgi:hypothetical protein